MIGNSYQIDALSSLVSQAEMRHEVISQNIANVNTPGYQSLEVSFEGVLNRMTDGRDGESNPSTPQIRKTEGLVVRQDGNNVDIDKELGDLTKNAMHFETYTQLLSSKISMMKSAITGQ